VEQETRKYREVTGLLCSWVGVRDEGMKEASRVMVLGGCLPEEAKRMHVREKVLGLPKEDKTCLGATVLVKRLEGMDTKGKPARAEVPHFLRQGWH
jgi:hypothetical protein